MQTPFSMLDEGAEPPEWFREAVALPETVTTPSHITTEQQPRYTSPKFVSWLAECDRILKETWPDYPYRDQAGQLGREAWYKMYFEDGDTSPEEAVAEEIDASN